MEFDYTIAGKPHNEMLMEISSCFSGVILKVIQEQQPQYLNDMPFIRAKNTDTFIDENVLIFKAHYAPYLTISAVGTLHDQELICKATDVLRADEFPSYESLGNHFGSYLSENDFIFITTVRDGKFSYFHFGQVIVDWLNDKVMPVIEKNNRKRVLDAIPAPPQYDIKNVLDNIFVLEDAESDKLDDIGRQGTCFYLRDIGFVTCAHVLTPHTKGFRAQHMDKRFPVEVVAQNEIIDLAILKIDGLVEEYNLIGLERGLADSMQVMDHIAVSGFPNYRIGDTGIVSPGLVVGYRPTHGIRRLLINASIIAGNSGGPVIDATNKVIGVAVTGADCSEQSEMTENHGVIPIEALSYLAK